MRGWVVGAILCLLSGYYCMNIAIGIYETGVILDHYARH